jgi:hypothetical protein
MVLGKGDGLKWDTCLGFVTVEGVIRNRLGWWVKSFSTHLFERMANSRAALYLYNDLLHHWTN